MSLDYLKKLKVREERTPLRNVRKIAKHFYEMYSSKAATTEPKRQHDVIKKIKTVILTTRPDSVAVTDPKELQLSWYASLAEELCTGRHGKASFFLFHLGEKALQKMQLC